MLQVCGASQGEFTVKPLGPFAVKVKQPNDSWKVETVSKSLFLLLAKSSAANPDAEEFQVLSMVWNGRRIYKVSPPKEVISNGFVN